MTPPENVRLSTCGGQPMLRRVRPGRLTEKRIQDFLRKLAETGNIRFSAESVGSKGSAVYYLRYRDAHFSAAMAEALAIAHTRLAAALQERARAAIGEGGAHCCPACGSVVASQESPSPLEGEGGSTPDLSGERKGEGSDEERS